MSDQKPEEKTQSTKRKELIAIFGVGIIVLGICITLLYSMDKARTEAEEKQQDIEQSKMESQNQALQESYNLAVQAEAEAQSTLQESIELEQQQASEVEIETSNEDIDEYTEEDLAFIDRAYYHLAYSTRTDFEDILIRSEGFTDEILAVNSTYGVFSNPDEFFYDPRYMNIGEYIEEEFQYSIDDAEEVIQHRAIDSYFIEYVYYLENGDPVQGTSYLISETPISPETHRNDDLNKSTRSSN